MREEAPPIMGGQAGQVQAIKLRLYYGGQFSKVPGDSGELRYVGGTVFNDAIPLTFSYMDLVGRLNDKFSDTVSIKYQAPGEELDPDMLIAVTDDDDLQELYNEYLEALQRRGSHEGMFRVKLFVFTALQFEMEMHDFVEEEEEGASDVEECLACHDSIDFNDYCSEDGGDVDGHYLVHPSSDTELQLVGGAVGGHGSCHAPAALPPAAAPSASMNMDVTTSVLRTGLVYSNGLAALSVPCYLGHHHAAAADGAVHQLAPAAAANGFGAALLQHQDADMAMDADGGGEVAAAYNNCATGAYGGYADWQELDDPYQDEERDKVAAAQQQRHDQRQQFKQQLQKQHEMQDAAAAATATGWQPWQQEDHVEEEQQQQQQGWSAQPQLQQNKHVEEPNTAENKDKKGDALYSMPLDRVRAGGSFIGLPSHISAFGDDNSYHGGSIDPGTGHCTMEPAAQQLFSHSNHNDRNPVGSLNLPSYISAFGDDVQSDNQKQQQQRQQAQLLPDDPWSQGPQQQSATAAGGAAAGGGSSHRKLAAASAGNKGLEHRPSGIERKPSSDIQQTPKGSFLESLPHVRKSNVANMTKIGEGAFGEVSRAEVFPYGTVAVKWLKKERFAKYIESFQREADVLAHLNHPNIIRMFGLVTEPAASLPHQSLLLGSASTPLPAGGGGGGGHSGNPPAALALGSASTSGPPAGDYVIAGIMMEYLKGGSLAQRFRSYAAAGRKMSLRERCRIALQAVLGMAYLHDQNPIVIHFDLKPDNLLLDGEGEEAIVKVADFGLSKHKFDNYISCHDMRGTLPYMAPELISNPNQVCEQCDVWSMGVVMWEMATLEVPFSELTAQQIMMGLMQGSLHLQIPQDCEPEWQGLISLCMEPSPPKRPTFRELAAHLDMLNRSLMPAPPPLLVQQQQQSQQQQPQQQQVQYHPLARQPSHPQQQQEQRAFAAVAALADVHMVQQQQQRQQHAVAAQQLASAQAHAIAQLQEQQRQAQQAAAATTAMLMAFQQQHQPQLPLQLPLPLFP